MNDRKQMDKGTAWGAGIIIFGVLLLLQNFNLLGRLGESTAALFFLAGALVFLVVFATDRNQWWALIPGAALGSLGLMILAGTIMPRGFGAYSGGIFLGGTGLGFWAIFANRREHAWAIIPGGVLVTLGLVASSVDWGVGGLTTGGVFFLGLAATFLLTFLGWPDRRVAPGFLIPAGILFCLGLLVMSISLFRWALPIALILMGVWLFIRPNRNTTPQ